ncbi:MAG TPA: DUF488 family protein [Terriglobales bacterium]|jgi:uncharacterized protein YeaO (DUF488 family)
MPVSIKRVYLKPSPEDGARVLVDRLWPRGLTKQAAALDAWLKVLAPSDELRRWFHEHPQQRSKFRQQYLRELTSEAAAEALQQLHEIRDQNSHLTLLFASKNEDYNNASVLRELVDGERKPPTGTGPVRAASSRRARAQRRP